MFDRDRKLRSGYFTFDVPGAIRYKPIWKNPEAKPLFIFLMHSTDASGIIF
jgi:hypothetical protein